MTLVRRCAIHGNVTETRNGVPFCPWGRGHYPEEWVETDTTNPAHQVTKGAPSAPDEVADWRASIGKTPLPKKPDTFRNATTNVVEKMKARPAAPVFAPRGGASVAPERPEPIKEATVPAAASVTKAAPSRPAAAPASRPPNPSGRKCGKCGARDHDARNHDKVAAAVARPAPAPPPQLPPAGKLEPADSRAPRRLVAFLYALLADVPPGTLERAFERATTPPPHGGWLSLEAYARELGERLTEVA